MPAVPQLPDDRIFAPKSWIRAKQPKPPVSRSMKLTKPEVKRAKKKPNPKAYEYAYQQQLGKRLADQFGLIEDNEGW